MKPHGMRAARWLYRWNLSSSIIGVVFSVLTFAAVFSLMIGGTNSLLVSAALVLMLFLGLGTFLDKVARFWSAQALVGTVRNQFLVDHLYQKELIALSTSTIPQLKAVRLLLTYARNPMEPRFDDSRLMLIEQIDAAISRTEMAIANKKWKIAPEEDVYNEQT